MRTNLPVTGTEVQLAEGEVIVSKTDTRGILTYVNRTFMEISGFTEAELIGQPHNIVRHPDMPAVAFADLWRTLKTGRPWVAMVKNRCKNGDHYWVEAQATPFYEDGKVAGYMSVRKKPTRAQVDAAERAYAALRTGADRKHTVRYGKLVPRWRWTELNPLWHLSLSTRLFLIAVFVAAFGSGLVALPRFGYGLEYEIAWIAAGTLFMAFSAWWLWRDIVKRLDHSIMAFRQIAAGSYDDVIAIDRNDEIGQILISLKSLQIKHGFEVKEQERVSEGRLRIQQALDQSTSCVMIADAERNIIFMNRAISTLFQRAEEEFRKDLPEFIAAKVLGSSMDLLLTHPELQPKLIDELAGSKYVEVKFGRYKFSLAVNPVCDENGRRLGTVAEWRDRTFENAIETEVDEIVAAAAKGDLSQRLVLEGKPGFFGRHAKHLNELLDTIVTGLTHVETSMAALSNGNLAYKMDVKMEGNFGRVLDSVRQTFTNLTSIVQQITESADSIATAAGEVSSGNTDLSERTEQQAANLEETASSMEELTSTVRQTADNARQASKLAVSAADVAAEGGTAVNQVVQTMASIEASSKKIVDIISVIDGIAFQTNILALNAAVEAARAGEQGRGFAVVASEVRTLAQRSANAAKEIKSLIGDSVERVTAGTTLVGQAGATMSNIVTSVKQVTDIIGEISSAAQEQSSGIEQVNAAITQMDESTQQNAALVEEASAAAHSLAEQANALIVAVSRFQLEPESSRKRQAAATPPTSTAARAAPHNKSKQSPAALPARRAKPARSSGADAPMRKGAELKSAAGAEESQVWQEF